MAWTSQHSCGSENAECQIVMQYMCNDGNTAPPGGPSSRRPTGAASDPPANAPPSMRGNHKAHTRAAASLARSCASLRSCARSLTGVGNGPLATNPDPNNPQANRAGSRTAFYQACNTRERNKGLYTADQNLNNNDAHAHAQNPNGARSGLECPEERDYYPYWAPSPWKDLMIMTNNLDECALTPPGPPPQNSLRTLSSARGYCARRNAGNGLHPQREWPARGRSAQCTASPDGGTWHTVARVRHPGARVRRRAGDPRQPPRQRRDGQRGRSPT